MSMSNNVWYRWQFLFSSEDKFRDKLINRLEKLEQNGKWQNKKNYTVRSAFKHTADIYAKTQKIQDVGKITINFQGKNIIIWVKQSFYYEIDVCVPAEDKNTSIENIIKDVEKTNFADFIKENILSDLQEDVILGSMLLNFYKYQSIVAVGDINVEVPVEKLLNICLSEISAEYAALSKTTSTHLFFSSRYKDSTSLFFIQFHDGLAHCIERDGGNDVVHDIVSLHLANIFLEKEKYLLFEIESKISETNNRIYTIIEDTIKSKQNIDELKDEFLNVLGLKKNLSKCDEAISEIRRITRGIMEILNGTEETIIQGSGIIKHLCSDVEKRNEHINFLMKKLYKNLNSLEQIVLEAISTETLSGIHRSISVQEQISEILKSTHSLHAGILILEIVIFAEIIITLIEAYPGYDHFPEIVKFELVIVALFLGVACSILLTRFITKNKVLERILK